MVTRSREPFFWVLFTGGGMLAALVLPALVALLWIAQPLGWIEIPSFIGKVQPAFARLFLFVLISSALFHWAHRFRYTLYDGLQLEHLYGLIAVTCYGSATAMTMLAAWVLWTF
jgi:fumarate reductase subunit D